LADLPRKDKGKSRFFEVYRKAAMVAAWMYLEHRQRPRIVFEAITEHHELLDVPETKLPSYETVRSFLNNPAIITPAMRTLARDGRRAYQEAFAPYVSRAYKDVYANDCWISDHMICDVEVRNTLFPEAEWGTPIRLRMTSLIDFRSRYIVGVSFCWEGSSRSLATALRHAVTAYGPCLWLYLDNGHDFDKAAKGAMPAYMRKDPVAMANWTAEVDGLQEHGIISRLGIMIQNCLTTSASTAPGPSITRVARRHDVRTSRLFRWPNIVSCSSTAWRTCLTRPPMRVTSRTPCSGLPNTTIGRWARTCAASKA
jgi:hypothetical protein